MGKGKRIAILVVLGVGILAFVLGPLLRKGSEGTDMREAPAVFSFPDNLAVRLNEIAPIEIEVTTDDISELVLIYQDSIFKRWTNPKGTIRYNFEGDYFGLGARQLVLQSTVKSGEVFTDVRLVRVLSDVDPVERKARVVGLFPHNPVHFTQGFEFSNGVLYESTGQYNESKVMQIGLATGNAIEGKSIGLDGNYFGEGITVLGDEIFQITWQEQKCFVYNKNTMQLLKDLSYTGEGWGLCNDGKSLIMSDGTERLYFRDPKSFQVQRVIEVYDRVGPRVRLNELEYIDGKIYANVWMLELILVIDPNTGKVLEEIDGSEVAKQARLGGEVMNGIAWNPATKKLYLTGKNWRKTAEVVIE